MTPHLLNHNQICTIFVLTIVMMSPYCFGSERNRQQDDLRAFMALSQEMPFLNKFLANDNEETFYSQLKKLHQNQPNYLLKWPSLRDLVYTTDFEENIPLDELETTNSRFIDRLKEIATSAIDMEDARQENYNYPADGTDIDKISPASISSSVPLKVLTPSLADASVPKIKIASSYKDNGTKKSVNYMSPCHFKICNMGRKRNSRILFQY